jgi:hypothetical protein
MSNATKNAALGESYGAASNRLRKNVMFLLITLLKMDTCFQCGEKIESVDQLSVEHKQPWLSAPDPKAAFFDLNNIAFSHLSCNAGAASHPKRGGTFDAKAYNKQWQRENSESRNAQARTPRVRAQKLAHYYRQKNSKLS